MSGSNGTKKGTRVLAILSEVTSIIIKGWLVRSKAKKTNELILSYYQKLTMEKATFVVKAA